MIDSNIKLSDWKALAAIQDIVDDYRSGKTTDYASLIKISEVLEKFGFVKIIPS